MTTSLLMDAEIPMLVPTSSSIKSSDTVKIASDGVPEARFHNTNLVFLNRLLEVIVSIDNRSGRSPFRRCLCCQFCNGPDGSIGVRFPVVLQARDRSSLGFVKRSCLSLTVPVLRIANLLDRSNLGGGVAKGR